MLSSSDSEDLPDIAQVLSRTSFPGSRGPTNPLLENPPVVNFRNAQKKRKRRPASPSHASQRSTPQVQNDPSSRPHKKRKLQNTKVNGKARASSPIELTSDDEPTPRAKKTISKPNNSKNDRPKLPSTEVIDLCSDTEPSPPKPLKRTKVQPHPPPRDEDVIELLSSEAEEAPRPSQLQSRPDTPGLPNGVNHKSPLQASVGTLREEEEEEEVSMEPMEISDISQVTFRPPPLDPGPRQPSLSMSPVPIVMDESPPPLPPPPDPVPKEAQVRSLEPEVHTGPLQSIYNDVFHRTPCPEDTAPRNSALSSGRRLHPHPTVENTQSEAFDLNLTPPPLLTASFFARAKLSLPPPPKASPPSEPREATTLSEEPSPRQTSLQTASPGPASSPRPTLVQESRAASHPPQPSLDQMDFDPQAEAKDEVEAPDTLPAVEVPSPLKAVDVELHQETAPSPEVKQNTSPSPPARSDTLALEGGPQTSLPHDACTSQVIPDVVPSQAQAESRACSPRAPSVLVRSPAQVASCPDTPTRTMTAPLPQLPPLISSAMTEQPLKLPSPGPVLQAGSSGDNCINLAPRLLRIAKKPSEERLAPQTAVSPLSPNLTQANPVMRTEEVPDAQASDAEQEVADMLLASGDASCGSSSEELTDEELLVIGLQYPVSDEP
ncbi:hypothetical protein AN958_07616 [Leucoagaricus sp. SymC.cos]|nr:hypothetical protein AN958_07616 [Leucoagaricus sp. SymC.cos]